MENPGSFQETEDTQKLLPNLYEQPSTNEHFHLIQIYKVKISVQFQNGLPFSDCLCARKYTVNKKIPERWAQKALWICTAKMNITSAGSDLWRDWCPWKPGLGGGRSQVWGWRVRCIVRPIFPGIIFKDKRRKVDLFWRDGRKQLVEAVHMVDFVLQS